MPSIETVDICCKNTIIPVTDYQQKRSQPCAAINQQTFFQAGNFESEPSGLRVPRPLARLYSTLDRSHRLRCNIACTLNSKYSRGTLRQYSSLRIKENWHDIWGICSDPGTWDGFSMHITGTTTSTKQYITIIIIPNITYYITSGPVRCR